MTVPGPAWDRFISGVVVAQNARIEELRKRLEREPGSPLFAQYAEELRRAGELGEAIRVCREGLQKHANYATARITLARALASSGDAAGARSEFEAVLKVAPDNVIAKRGIEDLGSDGARAWGEKVATTPPASEPAAARHVAPEPAVVPAVPERGAEPAEAAAAAEEPAPLGGEPQSAASLAPSEVPASAEDEDYELEPVRPAAPSGPPQLTFRPLLEDEDAGGRPAAASRVEREQSERGPAELATPAKSEPAPAARRTEERPAGVELASPTLAQLYFDQGSFERAAQIYEELLGREPGNARLAEGLKESRARIGTRVEQGQRGKREELVRRALSRLEELRAKFQSAGQSRAQGVNA